MRSYKVILKCAFTLLLSVLFVSAGNSRLEPPYSHNFLLTEDRESGPELYWEWEPEPRWLSGVNWGGSAFFGSIGFGENFLGSTLTSDEAIDVEIRFDSNDTTYCQTYRRDLGYSAAGVGIFRGSVWDISDPDNHRRLNLCFVEWNDGTGEHEPNLIWDPDNSNRGRREYLLIMLSDYDGTGTTYDNDNSGIQADVVYGWWPKLQSGYSFFETDPADLRIRLAFITNFFSVSDDELLTLQWEFEEEGIDHFDLYYSLTSPPDLLLDQLDSDIREYVHTGLTNDIKIYYQLYGIGPNGDVIYYSQQIWGKSHPVAHNMDLSGTWDGRESYGDIWGYTDPNTGIEYALLCSRYQGLSIIDISDDPVEVGFVPSFQSWADAKDVKVYDQYAILVKENEPAQVIDMTNPANPNELSTIHFGISARSGGAHNCFVDGQYLYVVGHDAGGVEIYDMTTPQSPELAGHYSTYYYHDIYVREGIAYAAAIYGEGVDILDVSDPSEIQLLANFNYPGSGAHNCWTTEDGNYLIVGDEIGDGPWTRIFDIRDLENIRMVSEYIVDDDATVHNSYVRDNMLYVAHYGEGLRIVDLANPEEPHEIAYYDTYLPNEYGYHGCWSVYPYFESGKIIASDMQSGLFVLDYQPPLAIDESVPPNQFYLKQNYPNPLNPTTITEFSLGSDSFVNLAVFDVTGKTIKTLVNSFQTAGIHHSQWNGTNDIGMSVPSGIYFLTLEAAGFIQNRKMVLLK